MKKTLILSITLIGLFLLTISQTQAQNKSSEKDYFAFGMGLGLPYGAIGGKLTYNPADNFALFGGIGYNLAGIGYNFGAEYIFPSTKKTNFYLTAMVGTNASTKVIDLPKYDNSYFGPSFGAGLKINFNYNYLDLGLLVPVRNSDYYDTVEVIKKDPQVGEFTEAFPVLLHVGFHFGR